MSSRATVYLDTRLFRAAKVKAAHTDTSVSHLINEALRLAFKEDHLDQAAFEKTAKEPSRSLEAVMKDLKRDGLL